VAGLLPLCAAQPGCALIDCETGWHSIPRYIITLLVNQHGKDNSIVHGTLTYCTFPDWQQWPHSIPHLIRNQGSD